MKKYLITLVAAFALWGYAGGYTLAAVQSEQPTPTPDQTVEATSVVGLPPAESTTEVTVSPTEPAPTQEPEQRSLFNTATLGELALFLGLSALAGGGIVAIILSFLGKKEVRDRVEDARKSWSPEQQAMLSNFTDGFERVTSGILDFLKAVQDNKPNDVVVAQVLNSPQLKAGIKNGVDKAMDDAVGIRG